MHVQKGNQSQRFWRSGALFLLGCILLSLLTFVCFRLHADAGVMALLYLIVVMLTSLQGRFVPALLISILALFCLTYLFTLPLFNISLVQPLDFAALFAYLTAALFITTLISRVRKSLQEVRALNDKISLDSGQIQAANVELNWKTAFFEAQICSAPDGILVVDGEGRKMLQNQRMIDLWNIPPQIADKPDDASELECVTKQAKNPRQFVEKVAYLYDHPDEISQDEIELIDGRFLDRYSSPVRGKGGKYYGRIWTFRDTTERHLAEITARQLAAIVTSSDDAIIGKDLDGVITSWNSGAERIFGYTGKEMIDTSIMRLIPPDRQGEELEILSRVRHGERCDHFETIRLAKGGRQLDVSVTVSPIKDSTGRVVGASKVIRDVSEQKRAEQELYHAKEAAEAANRAKSQFLANMSHEIRTPMNGVIGMTGLLLGGELNSEQRGFAEIIRTSGETLLTLINDILDFSKMESGKLVFEFLDFDLVETVESTLELPAIAAHSKGIELACEIAPNVQAGLRGDSGRLRQILPTSSATP